MSTFCLYPLSENGRSASGVKGAVVNAANGALARARANAMTWQGHDPDFTDDLAFGVTEINSGDSLTEFLIDGMPLAFGMVRRGF